ncbi:MAG: type I-E CRISPR-associated protein Cas6/Cse3/CasE [Candidatus Thiodiazotropha sp.]
MFFSRIELRRSGSEVAQLLKAMSADDYRHHQFVWQLFKGVKERDFLYRREDQGNWPRFYTVSKREPHDSERLWSIETKPFAPKLVEGMPLAFSLRVNPVVKRRDDTGKQRRHDVVMDLKRKSGFRKLSLHQRDPMPKLMRDAGLEWLASRSEQYGFTFKNDLVTVDGYEQHRSVKRDGEKPIRFSTLDFGGMLTVANISTFERTLFNGIGPSKGMGCGMLMVRRL